MISKRVTPFFWQITVCLLFLGGSLRAQPYSQPPYLFSNISSSGNYDLTGKKFYISNVNYNAILPSDYNAQKEVFSRYLEESLILRGATSVTDSLNADFYIVATVDYWNSSMDVTKTPKHGDNHSSPAVDYFQSGHEKNMQNYFSVSYGPDKGTYFPLPMNSASTDKGDKKYAAKQKIDELIYKTVIVKAYELSDGNKNDLWITQALDSRGDFKFLPSDCAMVYLMMRAYGNDMEKRKCFISEVDPFFAMFGKSNTQRDVCFLPNCQSTDKNLNLFLVKKSDEGLICLVEDNNLLSTDLKHKNYDAALKIGDQTINCSKMYYDVRPVKFSRFLTLLFPDTGKDIQNFDLVFFKKNNPEKIKEALTNIKIRMK